MSKAIEQLFASGIPSMAQMARMRREANNRMQGNSDSVDSSVSSPVRQSAKDIPPMVPSVTHGLEATETKPAAQNVKMKDIEVEKSITATDNRSSIVESAPKLETIRDQSPARKDNKPSTSSADNGRIHQIESKKRKGNDEERKPKQKKKKKKKSVNSQQKLYTPVNWLDSDARSINETPDMDDFDSLLKAHEQPTEISDNRRERQEASAPAKRQEDSNNNLEDVALNRKQKYKRKGGPKAATGKNATSKIQHIPQAKPAVEKTPFVPRVVCKYWESGHCQNGDKCTFLHAGEKKDPRKSILCRHFITGSCRKGDLCPFSHNTKLEACRHFHVKGICLTGEECPFAHEDASEQALASMKSKNTPCRFYHLKGFCTSGDDCLYSHQNQSDSRLTQLKDSETCKYFLSGNCIAGDECLFSHDVNSKKNTPVLDHHTPAETVQQPTLANFQLHFE